jgi:exonuclease III
LHPEELKQLIDEKDPLIIFLSETRTTMDIEDIEINIEGFSIIRCDSTSRYTGGCAIYVKSSISYKLVAQKSFIDHNYFLSIEIMHEHFNSIYTVIYHSPNSNHQNFLQAYEQYCDELLSLAKPIIIVGDFNINVAKKSTESDILNTINCFCGMKQKVTDYTREEFQTKSIIDLVLTDNENVNVVVDNTTNISDHNIIYINIWQYEKSDEEQQRVTSWKKYNKTKLNTNINNNISWADWPTGLNEKCDIIIDNLLKSVNEIVEIKVFDIRRSNLWYTQRLRSLKICRDLSHQKAIFTDDEEDWKIYRQNRNVYCRNINNAKDASIQEKIEQADSNTMWKVLKSIVKNRVDTKKSILFNDTLITNNETIAQKFNEYFIESVKDINKSIDLVDYNEFGDNIEENDHCFKFKTVNKIDIWNILNKIKTKSGIDNINVKVMKDSFDTIGEALTEIINESIITGTVPEKWKVSTVIPIPKVPKTNKSEEFRPINMLPVYEKILECVVKQQLLEFIEQNNILCDGQSGFRKRHSCETALNLIVAGWKEKLDEGRSVLAVYLDLKRAFETIDRKILLKKLHKYGIRGTELKWFESYLEGRYQRTLYNKNYSDEEEITLGVPQGSTLGPLLFILYVNDIVATIQHCTINLFADDTLIYITGQNLEDMTEKLNMDLVVVARWLKANKLMLNLSKTKFQIITHKSTNRSAELQVYIDQQQLEKVEVIKYLGVLIDSKLNFNDNFNYVLKKMEKKINFLGRIRKKLTRRSKITVYKAIISPHVDYCSSILYLATKEQMRRLQLVQNRAMRIVLDCGWRTSRVEMLNSLGWQTVEQRIRFNTLVLVHKIKNGLVPNYLTNKVTFRQNTRYPLRNASDFGLPKVKKTATQNSVFYNGLKLYNELPNNVKETNNMNEFKKQCSLYVKSKFSLV